MKGWLERLARRDTKGEAVRPVPKTADRTDSADDIEAAVAAALAAFPKCC